MFKYPLRLTGSHFSLHVSLTADIVGRSYKQQPSYTGVVVPLYLSVCKTVQTSVSTFERSRYAHLRIVIQRLEEVLVWHLDVPHPVEQILRPGIVDSELDELASNGHVRRTFGHVETVRHRPFTLSACLVIDPRKLEPVPEVVTADDQVNYVK